MQEIFNLLYGYLKGVWNKRWYGMFITWLICVAGWIYIYQMPDVYVSKAKIYIDTQSLLKPLLRGLTIQTNVNQEINLMVKTLLTTPNVKKMIRLSDLDLLVKDGGEMNALINKLKRNIKFKKARRSRINIYDLTYKSDADPKLVQKVLQSVITVFIENTVGLNQDDSDSAMSFLDNQIIAYEKRMLEADIRKKEFKRQNLGMLPGSSGNFFSQMEKSKDIVNQTKLEIEEAKQAKITLQEDLNKIKNSKAYVDTSYDKRIERLHLELDNLLLRYTVKHPEVRSIKNLISDLEDRRLVNSKSMPETTASDQRALELSNPVYQDLKIKLGALNSKISSLTIRLSEYEKRFKDVSQKLDEALDIEVQLKSLERDYSVVKSKLTGLISRRETAMFSETVNKTSDGIQFNVLESPSFSRFPTGPDRILLSSLLLLVSIAAGIGFALLISLIKPVFHSTLDLERVIGLPILGVVSVVTSEAERKRRRMLILSYLSLFFILVLVYTALIAWYMRGFWNMVDNLLNVF